MSSTEDSFPILGIDYVQFFVGNAKQAAHYYESFGFTPRAFMGLETGLCYCVSYMVQQGDVRLVFTGALDGDSAIAEHVKLHGDGVHDIALTVPDAEESYRVAIQRGARSVAEPEVFEDEKGKVVKAAIVTYGENYSIAHSRNWVHRTPLQTRSTTED